MKHISILSTFNSFKHVCYLLWLLHISFHFVAIFHSAKTVVKVIQVAQWCTFLNNLCLLSCMLPSSLLRGYASLMVFLLCGCFVKKPPLCVTHPTNQGSSLWERPPFFCQSYPHALYFIPMMAMWWKEIGGEGAFLAHACLHFYSSWFLIFSLCSTPAFRAQLRSCRLLFRVLMCLERNGVQCDLREPGHWWWPLQQSGL